MCKAHIFAALRECPMDTRSECPRTHTLNLSYCYNITNTSIKKLKNCHTLNLSHCSNIRDIGIKELKKCHTLNLSHCIFITDIGIKKLKNCLRECPKTLSQRNIYLLLCNKYILSQ